MTRNTDYEPLKVLDDSRAGLTYKKIAERRGVSIQTVSKIAIDNDIFRRPRHPVRPCPRCKKPTRRADTCRACVNYYNEPTEADALTGGQWVIDKRRRVLVWQSEQVAS